MKTFIRTLTGLCCVVALHGCFDNDHNRDKAKDQSKPSLQMQQDEDKK
ncbi:hypothetical protein [Pseudomonas sp. LP_7_YM]|nr:hypothetical protein [Pseudomonas sp. LP_7_YM]TDV72521.1 hypothetical protein EC915_101667 [Pseudomonas sp. LP_7_YM]